MGRGRAKAKQTKVARQLKYNTPQMDLESLQRELAGKSSRRFYESSSHDEEEYYSDPYAEYWRDEDGNRKVSGQG
ncbi:DUF3073 domain-containing protein [Corynebacterium spheniscorum]|uniref:DUF3073 domain-containing protein n=1 Tax=Corynebacterium spheniscorum TaxID=185761 RepID=A0A1I2UAT9_9CORY|nr:DUF3073 domain-containing protein [Corynebacterium spheniscorum]KAA8720769.1 DUF3073 domain-containing protein [Corynebacterium spheniscorum]SFG73489.1 Protein of unknown function [Corynebacterium spheniscorum]